MAATVVDEKSTSEGRDTCYFPECQKDTNCKCEMCLASINATLDLVSSRGSSLKEKKQMSIPLSPYMKTPKQRKDSVFLTATPLHWSTARSMPTEKKMVAVEEKNVENENEKEKKSNKVYLGRGCRLAMWVVAISMVFAINLPFPPSVRTTVILGTKMSEDRAKTVGEELDIWRRKPIFLEKNLCDVFGQNINNGSIWNRSDGFLHLRCTLYANQLEEVLKQNFQLEFKVRNQGKSWTSIDGRVSSSSAVKLSENTWILEYHRSLLVQKSLLVHLVWEWLCFRAAQIVDDLTRFHWFLQKPSSFSPPPT